MYFVVGLCQGHVLKISTVPYHTLLRHSIYSNETTAISYNRRTMDPSIVALTKRVLRAATSISPPFGRQRLVVVAAQLQSHLIPGSKVVGNSDGAALRSLGNAVGDVLRERCGAGNRRLVDLGMLPDLVRRSVALQSSHLLPLRATFPVAGVLLL